MYGGVERLWILVSDDRLFVLSATFGIQIQHISHWDGPLTFLAWMHRACNTKTFAMQNTYLKNDDL